MRREPYFESAHIMQETPLHETWHKMYDIPYNKDKDLPELYMNMIQLELPFNWSRPKPIMLLHTNGGPLIDGAPVYAWSRDMPKYLIEAIINNFANQYHIIQVCKHELQAIKSPAVEVLFKPMSNFELFALVRASAKRVLIDSCLQHAAAAYRLPSTVLWIGTKPEMFGYKLHTNIRSKAPLGNVKNIESLYFDYQLDGFFHECPYNSPDEMFDVQEVLRTISRV